MHNTCMMCRLGHTLQDAWLAISVGQKDTGDTAPICLASCTKPVFLRCGKEGMVHKQTRSLLAVCSVLQRAWIEFQMLNNSGQRIGRALQVSMQTRASFVDGDVQHRARNRRFRPGQHEDDCPLYEKVDVVVLLTVIQVREIRRRGAWS